MSINNFIQNYLEERLQRTKVIRHGKTSIKITSDKKGFRFDPENYKEVKMTPLEIKLKKKAVKKGVKTRKAHKSPLTQLRRKQSLNRRGNWRGSI